MKALISPNEIFNHTYVTQWEQRGTRETSNGIEPAYFATLNTIENCVRVADVAETEFEVAEPLFWVDCSDECTRDNCYYKDGVVYLKPVDVAQ